MENTSSNQRRFERFHIFERATLIIGEERTAVILVDVSLGGAQVLAKTSFPNGTKCQLSIGSGELEEIFQGHIRYGKPGEHDLVAVGFKFTSDSSEERVAIANLVNRIFMNPSENPIRPSTNAVHDWLAKQVA